MSVYTHGLQRLAANVHMPEDVHNRSWGCGVQVTASVSIYELIQGYKPMSGVGTRSRPIAAAEDLAGSMNLRDYKG